MEILHQTEALVQEVISTLKSPRAGVRVSKLLGWIRVFTLTPLIPPRIDWKLPPQHGSALAPRTDGHIIRKPVARVMRASPYIMQVLLMSEYRRRCPSASWVDMERLIAIGEAACMLVRPVVGRGRWSVSACMLMRCQTQIPGRMVRCLCPASM